MVSLNAMGPSCNTTIQIFSASEPGFGLAKALALTQSGCLPEPTPQGARSWSYIFDLEDSCSTLSASLGCIISNSEAAAVQVTPFLLKRVNKLLSYCVRQFGR